MPSLNERSRNNVRAGVFVTLSLGVALAVLIALSDVAATLAKRSETYTVAFDVSSGVANLKTGSDVRVGGMRMGKVVSVEPRVEGDVFREIDVTFTLDRRVKIFADANVLVTAPLVGSDAWLDIPYVGHPDRPLPADKRLDGTPSVGMLTNLLGPENAGKAGEMIEDARVMVKDARGFTEFLGTLPDEYESRVVPVIDDAGAVVSDLRHNRWPNWADSVDHVMTWAEGATANLDQLVAEAEGLFTDGRAVIAENREPLQTTVANLESATTRFNEETLEKVHRLLDTGQDGMDHAKAALETFRVDYAGWATNIQHALADLNLTAQQLKLASIETRRSPWKLLYRPSPDELQHEFLYEATRAFAMAAADLKATSDSVNRILLNHGDLVSADETMYRRLEAKVLDSLSKYEKAQQDMLDVLVSDRQR